MKGHKRQPTQQPKTYVNGKVANVDFIPNNEERFKVS